MDCTRASTLMMGYFDRILNDNEKLEFIQHTKTCSLCSEEFLALEEAISGVGKLEDFMAPDCFDAEIMDSIDLKKFALARRKTLSAPLVLGVLLIISFLSGFIYLRYGSVDVTGIYKYLTSVTEWVNVTTMVKRFIKMGTAVAMVWIQLLKDMPLYYKGIIGAYFALLSFLCSFFIGIHLILIKLTAGQITKGGSVYEK